MSPSDESQRDKGNILVLKQSLTQQIEDGHESSTSLKKRIKRELSAILDRLLPDEATHTEPPLSLSTPPTSAKILRLTQPMRKNSDQPFLLTEEISQSRLDTPLLLTDTILPLREKVGSDNNMPPLLLDQPLGETKAPLLLKDAILPLKDTVLPLVEPLPKQEPILQLKEVAPTSAFVEAKRGAGEDVAVNTTVHELVTKVASISPPILTEEIKKEEAIEEAFAWSVEPLQVAPSIEPETPTSMLEEATMADALPQSQPLFDRKPHHHRHRAHPFRGRVRRRFLEKHLTTPASAEKLAQKEPSSTLTSRGYQIRYATPLATNIHATIAGINKRLEQKYAQEVAQRAASFRNKADLIMSNQGKKAEEISVPLPEATPISVPEHILKEGTPVPSHAFEEPSISAVTTVSIPSNSPTDNQQEAAAVFARSQHRHDKQGREERRESTQREEELSGSPHSQRITETIRNKIIQDPLFRASGGNNSHILRTMAHLFKDIGVALTNVTRNPARIDPNNDDVGERDERVARAPRRTIPISSRKTENKLMHYEDTDTRVQDDYFDDGIDLAEREREEDLFVQQRPSPRHHRTSSRYEPQYESLGRRHHESSNRFDAIDDLSHALVQDLQPILRDWLIKKLSSIIKSEVRKEMKKMMMQYDIDR